MSKSKGMTVRIVQIILGIILIFFGLNGFLQFMPFPEMTAAATAFFGALFAAGYILPILNVIFIVVGLMYIFNKCGAFASVILFPLTLNIFLFHIFLDVATGIAGYVIFILNIYLLYVYFDSYRGMCKN